MKKVYSSLFFILLLFLTACNNNNSKEIDKPIDTETFFGISFEKYFKEIDFTLIKTENEENHYERNISYENLSKLLIITDKDRKVKRITALSKDLSELDNPYKLANPLIQIINKKYGQMTCTDDSVESLGKIGESCFVYYKEIYKIELSIYNLLNMNGFALHITKLDKNVEL